MRLSPRPFATMENHDVGPSAARNPRFLAQTSSRAAEAQAQDVARQVDWG
jgi:hypothetical protein